MRTITSLILISILFKCQNASILPDIRQTIQEADLLEMFSDVSKPGINK